MGLKLVRGGYVSGKVAARSGGGREADFDVAPVVPTDVIYQRIPGAWWAMLGALGLDMVNYRVGVPGAGSAAGGGLEQLPQEVVTLQWRGCSLSRFIVGE